ncbi:plastocyanin/azurin family copper-binding protein [Dokdonella sp.]|uniref:cupredoxin domain-containing protein n=1 Tax=Dokdonella sp. TaxID=2291710 RepID=UPI00378465EA
MPAHSLRLLFAMALLASGAATAATHSVIVGGVTSGYYGDQDVLMFSPANLTINAGDSVVFTNAGGAHNVHADDESFRCAQGCDGGGGSGEPSASEWHATVVFDHPGSVSYHCDNHGSMGMTGTITVRSTSANVPITSGFTGTWVDAGVTGQLGLGLEVLADGNLVAEVYTFAPAGGQAWIGGVGPIVNGDHATITVSTINGPGGRFAPNFDPSQVTNTTWGTLTLRFSDCNHGTLDWASTVPGFASGSLPIIRVTLPAGLTCP